MEEKTEIKAVELVRCIRDEQAKLLAGKSNKEIMEFFHEAGEAVRRGSLPPAAAVKAANELAQPDWPSASVPTNH